MEKEELEQQNIPENNIEAEQGNSKRVVSNMIWKILERFGAQGVTFAVSIVLARILDPAIYGTVALITVITSIFQVFVECGFGNALVQKKDSDDVDFSTVFYFNIGMCVMLYIVLFFTAPLLEQLFNIEGFANLLRVLGIVILISGVKNVQQAYVSKYLLFKQFFFATLVGTVVAAGVGIWMAYSGYGVWAIIVQNVVNQAIDTILLWIIVKWKPKLAFSFSRFKRLFNYGWKFLVSSLIDKGYTEARSLIIGKKYSLEDLSFYNRGEQFPKVLGEGINYGVSSVLFPVMSRVQDDKPRLKELTRKSIRVGGFVTWPCMIGMAACSTTIISVILTDKWLPAAPFMIIFCITYGLFPISTANLCAINAVGKSDIFLILEIIKKTVGITIMVVTMWFGVMPIAIGMVVSSFISVVINAFPNKKLIDYRLHEQLIDMLPSLLISLAMGVSVYFMSYLPLPNWAILLIQVPSGIIIYFLIARIFKMRELYYIVNIAKKFIERRH